MHPGLGEAFLFGCAIAAGYGLVSEITFRGLWWLHGRADKRENLKRKS